jgi:N4-gp56 family major capsid protein
MALPTAASVISSGLTGYPTVYYDRTALDTLQSNLYFYPACELRPMPDMSGVAMQIFNYTKLSAVTTAVSPEGAPLGSGTALTQQKQTINLANYAQYVSFSNKVVLTAISDTVAEGAALLAYSGALSVDNVISTAVVTEAAVNSDAATIEVPAGSFVTAALAREAVWQLRGKDVKPKKNGLFFSIIHSLSAYDLVNDASAGGTLDLQKYSDELAAKNPALVGIQGQRIGNIGGAEWYESNAIPQSPQGTIGGKIAYPSFVFGWQAFLASSLGRTNLNQKNFTVTVRRYDQGNSIDVAGLIMAAAFYNFFFGVVVTPDQSVATNGLDHFRMINVQSSIG